MSLSANPLTSIFTNGPATWAASEVPVTNLPRLSMHFTAERRLYTEGDAARSVYGVTNGIVRTCQFLSDGRRQIDAFHQAGDFFGFEAGNSHRLAAEAVTDCAVEAYRLSDLETFCLHNEKLRRWLFGQAMTAMARVQEHSLLLGRASATQKLAAFLLEMAERSDQETMVELAMSRQDIADYLGLSIETVSRTLTVLDRDGLISLPFPRRVILRNRRALEKINT
jgi:CRP/FNR family nitrogen fixation transcriptional regulator